MSQPRRLPLAAIAIVLPLVLAHGQSEKNLDRDRGAKLMKAGNWKDAYGIYGPRARDPKSDPSTVADDLRQALQCLTRLGRISEMDEFLEAAIAAHGDNWRLLKEAASSYRHLRHDGAIVAGVFTRGPHRGGQARHVNAFERDRARALQLYQQAMPLLEDGVSGAEASKVFWELAHCLLTDEFHGNGWRLQALTDLKALPDYDEGYSHHRPATGAPVNPDGTPVLYSLPASWEAARSDGERWRWALAEVGRRSPEAEHGARFHFASFLHQQLGVQTLAEYGWYFGRGGDEESAKPGESGTWDLHTLTDDETIARLASGVKRLGLPDEFNFVKILHDLADGGSHAEASLDLLATIYENRRQYVRAAELRRQAIERFGPGNEMWRRLRLEQITGNWGKFEPAMTSPAGEGASVDFRFRNGKKVALKARRIDVRKLLDDLKAYLKSDPKRFDWNRVQIESIGHRLIEEGGDRYLGEEVASWSLDLSPRPHHWDRRVAIATPLQKAGAYWLEAAMEGGNSSRIVVWIADTAIVKKAIDGGAFYFVADAVSGQPIAKANTEFFGYRMEWLPKGGSKVHTRNFAEFTGADGQLIRKATEAEAEFQWIAIASTPEGRLAYTGFSNVWMASRGDGELDEIKAYAITDRPVYRPGQPVRFKFWVNRARYDAEGKSPYAGSVFNARIVDPMGEKVFAQALTADDYGGFAGELTLARDARLGVYQLFLPNDDEARNPVWGAVSFRVEEYKKPEFEVSVESPEKPVALGDKIAARIRAKYYFGAPVTTAKVKYTVTRTEHDARWYPVWRWDWLYGRGYGWFGYDYHWYPGWGDWGCLRPSPGYFGFGPWPWFPRQQPEVVAEAELPIGDDGTVTVEIDSALAKALHGDQDHRYEIRAEVTDLSRRTIAGSGQVLASRKPFQVHAWMDRGHYQVGDTATASFNARTLDNRPVAGAAAAIRLLKVTYRKDPKSGALQPVEAEVQSWKGQTDADGQVSQRFVGSAAGQYRVACTIADADGRAIDGGAVFVVRGPGFDAGDYRFDALELVPDRREYAPGEAVKLLVNADRPGAAVLLFVRAVNGVGSRPKLIRLQGKSILEEIAVQKNDMPNFFVEALAVHGGKVHNEVREIVVPPESRVFDVQVKPKAEKFKPGERTALELEITDPAGKPIDGTIVASVYDKAIEYISGGPNVPDIKEFFWKWRRYHHPQTEHSLGKGSDSLLRRNETGLQPIGVFGGSLVDDLDSVEGEARFGARYNFRQQNGRGGGRGFALGDAAAAPAAAAELSVDRAEKSGSAGEEAGGEAELVQPAVRKDFADAALWVGALDLKGGRASLDLALPENLSTWKIRVWAMGDGSRCGEGSAEVITTKDLLVRLQAPRFFVERDEVVLSANVHNFLDASKTAAVSLELDGPCLRPLEAELARRVEVASKGEARVDWRVAVAEPGEAVVRVKALTDVESDAMEMRFPVHVHGMLRTEIVSGAIRPEGTKAALAVHVPAERRIGQGGLELRWSPTLAAAMVDALPYLADYPYGCTEQTLNRFLPTVITQRVLLKMGLDLEAIAAKRTNLNAQEIGDDRERARRRAGIEGKNPVFDAAEVLKMVKAGLERLAEMQVGDGGWGWWSGDGERSWPHTTAVVVHGLQKARECEVALVPGILERGIEWLKGYQAQEVQKLKNAATKTKPWKSRADDLDALVFMVLADEKIEDEAMRGFLYRDRNELSVYSKAMLGLAFHRLGRREERDMLLQNVEQYLVVDDENQTAYLKLPESTWWWHWYGSEYEAQSYYLKLLAAVDPKSERAARLAKYLVNNRLNGSYWKSTRDTALVVEALADFIQQSGEDKPEMTLKILLDGKPAKEVKIDAANLFSFENRLFIPDSEIEPGRHSIELLKEGKGPLYFNAYMTSFTLEEPIPPAGLEVKVERRAYKLVPVDAKELAPGERGQALEQKVEKYKREPLASGATLKSGDLVEVELEIESKNDYEYLIFEDRKAAGFEPVEVRSGYNGNDLGAYFELRDERVSFFTRWLARGRHSVSYRLRAEVPGVFHALPATATGMYAPELRGNSSELKLGVVD